MMVALMMMSTMVMMLMAMMVIVVVIIAHLRNRTGEREDGKPCGTSLTIIFCEKTFRQT